MKLKFSLLIVVAALVVVVALPPPANGPASSEVNARISVIASAARCYVSVSVH